MKLRDRLRSELARVVIVGVILTLLAGCALVRTTTPLTTSEQTRLTELHAVVEVAASAVGIVRAFQDVEIFLYEQGRVSPDAHGRIQHALLVFFTTARVSMEAVQDVARPEAVRRDAARATIRAANQLVTALRKESHPQLDGFMLALEALVAMFL
jgi:hypothetical protein